LREGNNLNYNDFLKTKEIVTEASGFELDKDELNPLMFDWQKDIVRWAVRKGKCCLFEDCGLGKTLQQLAFSDAVSKHTGEPVLIVAPLAVAVQTVKEGEKFGYKVNLCRQQSEIIEGINITNYEMLHKFSGDVAGVVLDESSILKNHDGKMRKAITDKFRYTPYKLCCTATPAPNDFVEIGNHAEFLGIMSQSEMLSTFFLHDGGNTSSWRLKGHATEKFFAWVASWACCLTTPADLGYDGSMYQLPELNIQEVTVKSGDLETEDGQLLLVPEMSMSLSERRTARNESLADRVQAAADIVNNSNEQFLVWCDLNKESECLGKAINGAVEVKGADSDEHKRTSMIKFSEGDVRVLVSKPSIAGWGMNWQNCHNVIFVGLSDSFESYYQAVRRCWRFGQKDTVNVFIIISEKEGTVKLNIERKQESTRKMTSELVQYTQDILTHDIRSTVRMTEGYVTTEKVVIPDWLRSES
jgi:hypothetical protein